MPSLLLTRAGFALALLSLSGCTDAGGDTNTGTVNLTGVNGTWRVTQTVTSSRNTGAAGGCRTVGDSDDFYVNWENTSGVTIVGTDPQVPGSPTLQATASGRQVKWTGTGDNAGDSLALTLADGDAVMSGTAVDFDGDETPPCTNTYSVVATKVTTAPSIHAGDWTFLIEYPGSTNGLNLSTVPLTQKFASFSGNNRNTNYSTSIAATWTGAAWEGTITNEEAASLFVNFSGTFNAAGTNFTGTVDGFLGVLPLAGTIIGTNSRGNSVCAIVDNLAVWDLTFRPNGAAVIEFLGGSMAQTGCDVTYTFPGSSEYGGFTLSGPLNGQAWTARQGGLAAWPDRRYVGTFSGNPATSLEGSYTNVGSASDFGTITLTRRSTGGGSGCVAVNTGSWDLVFTGALGPTFENCTVTQNGCSLQFASSGGTPAITAVFVGPINGTTWSTTSATGSYFTPLSINLSMSGTLAGNPATSWSGTYIYTSPFGNGSGNVTATRN